MGFSTVLPDNSTVRGIESSRSDARPPRSSTNPYATNILLLSLVLLSTYLCTNLPTYLSTYLSTYLFSYLLTYLLICEGVAVGAKIAFMDLSNEELCKAGSLVVPKTAKQLYDPGDC